MYDLFADEDHGMLRMSVLDHLEELRSRILRALAGWGVAFLLCTVFAHELWRVVTAPAASALTAIGIPDGKLIQTSPFEAFNILWVKTPFVASLFLAAPWVMYQVWAFIAPGLYARERRLAAPFIASTAGLFLGGGAFAYFIALPRSLAFLLGIGRGEISVLVTVTEYFEVFVNVVLGVALVFELPVLIVFLTLLRIATPGFLLRNARYAILAILIVAAAVTQTTDAFNMMLFAVPLCVLYFVGVFTSYVLVLRRENRGFPRKALFIGAAVFLALTGCVVILAGLKYGYHFMRHWPFPGR